MRGGSTADAPLRDPSPIPLLSLPVKPANRFQNECSAFSSRGGGGGVNHASVHGGNAGIWKNPPRYAKLRDAT